MFASGFEVDFDYQVRSGYDIVGRDGVHLADKWKDGIRTFQSMHVHGFPNLFHVAGPQGGFYSNWVNRIELRPS